MAPAKQAGARQPSLSRTPFLNFNRTDVDIWLQWGGDINGGAVPGNVKCTHDDDLGKDVLSLVAHGDLFTGDGPKGVKHDANTTGDYAPRLPNEEWGKWDWTGYNATCAPHCDVKRVGAVVNTKIGFDSGRFEVMMKPCLEFGALSSLWTFNYTERYCDLRVLGTQCDPDYAKQCCDGPSCTLENDRCGGELIDNKEIDFCETPTALDGTEITDPSSIEFSNVRFTSYKVSKSLPRI